jgi:hypothetical protein
MLLHDLTPGWKILALSQEYVRGRLVWTGLKEQLRYGALNFAFAERRRVGANAFGTKAASRPTSRTRMPTSWPAVP